MHNVVCAVKCIGMECSVGVSTQVDYNTHADGTHCYQMHSKMSVTNEKIKKEIEKKSKCIENETNYEHTKRHVKRRMTKKSSLQLIRRIYMVGIRHMFHLKKYLCIVYKCSLSIRNASYVIQILLSHFIEHCSIKRHSTS